MMVAMRGMSTVSLTAEMMAATMAMLSARERAAQKVARMARSSVDVMADR